jgi:hypothetical protein
MDKERVRPAFWGCLFFIIAIGIVFLALCWKVVKFAFS